MAGQSSPLRIDVRKLRAVLDDVLAAVEAEHGAEVLVERDRVGLLRALAWTDLPR